MVADLTIILLQALEGKNVRDMLTSVGSGGGAAPAAAGPSGGDPAAPVDGGEKEPAEPEGMIISRSFSSTPPLMIFSSPFPLGQRPQSANNLSFGLQKKRSLTRIWASVCLTKRVLFWFPFTIYMCTSHSRLFGNDSQKENRIIKISRLMTWKPCYITHSPLAIWTRRALWLCVSVTELKLGTGIPNP